MKALNTKCSHCHCNMFYKKQTDGNEDRTTNKKFVIYVWCSCWVYTEGLLEISGLVTFWMPPDGFRPLQGGNSTAQNTIKTGWLLNIWFQARMVYSWDLPYRHKQCESQQESVPVLAALLGAGSTTITSCSINLDRVPCQLKVEGAIILAQAEVSSDWPCICNCSIQQSRHNVEIYIWADKHGWAEGGAFNLRG